MNFRVGGFRGSYIQAKREMKDALRMSDWVDAGKPEDLPPGCHKLVDVDDVMVALFNVDGEYYAIEDLCTHDGGELASGEVQGDEVICPRHGARFNIKTGAVTAPPAYQDVYVFPVRMHGGRLQVRDDRWD